MKSEDEEFQEEVPHRIHQCQGMVWEDYQTTIPVTIGTKLVRCKSRGELTKFGKKLLCHSCREEAIEKSKSDKGRNKK